ncbi:kinase-like domain-containing protein [Xylaria cf. heliscus]|nr:kinase-like domain-containing protein [Xylaria cf. heliscus]
MIPVVRSRPRPSFRQFSWNAPSRVLHWSPSQSFFRTISAYTFHQRCFPHRRRTYSTASNTSPPHKENVYAPEFDVEELEAYTIGGYHPTKIGDTFHHDRYEVVHKLGFGGYSTIWLARDRHLRRYVSLKIMVAGESSESSEGTILRMLCSGSDPEHPGRRFIPPLPDEFSFNGPNGHHTCLVQEPAGCNISESKEDAVGWMFPVETARSIAAQLIMGVSYLHSRGFSYHLDLHLRNFLLCGLDLNYLSPDELYKSYPPHKVPIRRVDGAAVEPHAPPYAVYPMYIEMPANQLVDPIIKISDYGTSFIVSTETSPKLHTPALYLPPEDFFGEPITQAADIWTLGTSLYEVLGERPLFEPFGWGRDSVVADIFNTLGPPPTRWWDKWVNREEFSGPDKSWVRSIKRADAPVFRPLHQRMWEMGRGETHETCQWYVERGEMRVLEELLRGMLAYEPAGRLTAEQLMRSEYMRPRDADLFEDFGKDKLPDDDIYVPPHHQPINPEDEDDVVPDQHAAFGIQKATQRSKEPAWKDLDLAELMKKGPAPGRTAGAAKNLYKGLPR